MRVNPWNRLRQGASAFRGWHGASKIDVAAIARRRPEDEVHDADQTGLFGAETLPVEVDHGAVGGPTLRRRCLPRRGSARASALTGPSLQTVQGSRGHDDSAGHAPSRVPPRAMLQVNRRRACSGACPCGQAGAPQTFSHLRIGRQIPRTHSRYSASLASKAA